MRDRYSSPGQQVRVRRAARCWLLATLVWAGALQGQAAANLLPRPERVDFPVGWSAFVLRPGVKIEVPAGSPALREIASTLAGTLRSKGVQAIVSTAKGNGRGAIRLDTLDSGGSESYNLRVSHQGIRLRGGSSAGVRWGVQTLLQLVEHAPDATSNWRVGAVDIYDAPRFAWRGSMLDVGRHLLTVRDIERHIDLLSRYKMNVLHWHLTEDQGWRLAITRYPRLTQVGAWRREADGSRYGGFYTHAQVRHLVEYARVRGVTIVPEIEMPGHSSAAIAAYPQLGCTGDSLTVPTTWGVFSDIYCAGKEETFTFLLAVLDEVMELFPSPVIHIGGDEAPKERWKACTSCQAVMRAEGLADEEALQSWFMQRIARYVARRGRRVIGWDEVLDGPYLDRGMVHSWRDSSFTRKAVLRGHEVIASPNEFTYLNRSANELSVAGVYKFEPVPPGLTPDQRRLVRGGEVPFWSEHIVSGANLELMALPRLVAFADVMWSAAPRDVADFQRRLATAHVPALRANGYAVGPSDQALVSMSVSYDSVTRKPVLRVPSMADGIVVRGTVDGTRPSATSKRFGDGSSLGGSLTRLQAFWNASPVREERRVAIEQHAGIAARVHTAPEVDRRYPGTGAWNLVDGMIGSTDHSDGLWQGWWVPEVTITLALPSLTDASHVRVNFLQNVRSWIVLPGRVEFSWSPDSVTWSAPVTATHEVPVDREGAFTHSFGASMPTGSRVRFVRIVARSRGPLPAGHPGAGQTPWLFADEVRVTSRGTLAR